MLASGKVVSDTAEVRCCGPTTQGTKVSGNLIKLVAKENSSILMGIFMMAAG